MKREKSRYSAESTRSVTLTNHRSSLNMDITSHTRHSPSPPTLPSRYTPAFVFFSFSLSNKHLYLLNHVASRRLSSSSRHLRPIRRRKILSPYTSLQGIPRQIRFQCLPYVSPSVLFFSHRPHTYPVILTSWRIRFPHTRNLSLTLPYPRHNSVSTCGRGKRQTLLLRYA